MVDFGAKGHSWITIDFRMEIVWSLWGFSGTPVMMVLSVLLLDQRQIARRALSPFFGLFNLGGVTGSVVSALSRDYRGKLISPS